MTEREHVEAGDQVRHVTTGRFGEIVDLREKDGQALVRWRGVILDRWEDLNVLVRQKQLPAAPADPGARS